MHYLCVQDQGRLQAAHKVLVQKFSREKADSLIPVLCDASWSWPSANSRGWLSSESFGGVPDVPACSLCLETAEHDDQPHCCRGDADNNIGVEGAKAIAAALEPRQGPDGSWHFNMALNELNLDSESFGGVPDAPACSLCLETAEHDDQPLCCRGDAGSNIGVEGAKAIAAALRPRQGPDGSWHFNKTINQLTLHSESFGGVPDAPACSCVLRLRSMMTNRSAVVGMQVTRLEMKGPRPSPPPWSPARALTDRGISIRH